MGLSVCYELRAAIEPSEARRIVAALHAAAKQLPFQEVHEVVEWTPRAGRGDDLDDEDARRLRQLGTQYGRKQRADGEEFWIEIPPRHVIGFSVDVADGAETAQFGLATHPAVIEQQLSGRAEWIETGLAGIYSWTQCCKTQYAGLQQYGGVENFVQAHTALIALLDQARNLGLHVTVHDDGGYWLARDRTELSRQLREWNGLVAALAGQLMDHLGRGPGGVQSPILTAPDFEHLEAEGLIRWSQPPAESE
uniref:Uncharacterized protein n=1 Tax=Schlesneria paludicola TaxID=360056 RepID=A0A7C4QQI9_9PLAN